MAKNHSTDDEAFSRTMENLMDEEFAAWDQEQSSKPQTSQMPSSFRSRFFTAPEKIAPTPFGTPQDFRPPRTSPKQTQLRNPSPSVGNEPKDQATPTSLRQPPPSPAQVVRSTPTKGSAAAWLPNSGSPVDPEKLRQRYSGYAFAPKRSPSSPSSVVSEGVCGAHCTALRTAFAKQSKELLEVREENQKLEELLGEVYEQNEQLSRTLREAGIIR